MRRPEHTICQIFVGDFIYPRYRLIIFGIALAAVLASSGVAGAHDHWLACVALSVGQIRYVDRCLYDYVQHGANAIGHGETKAPFLPKFIVLILLNLARRKGWQQAEIIYRQEVRKIVVVAQTILQRCQPLLSAEARATWQRLARLDQSFSSFWWLLQRGRHTAPLTAGAEYHLALGLLWHSLSKLLFRGISQ